MEKRNLVLVHSFPTNSIILSGLIEFLGRSFNVYFVDLPGFNTNVPRLENISLDGYSRFLEEKIRTFNLDSYILGGISFGFLVVNNTNVDDKCKALIALEPYLNTYSLKTSLLRRVINLIFLRVVMYFGLEKRVWESSVFHKFILWRRELCTKEQLDTTIRTIDPITFFHTAMLLFDFRKKPVLADKPIVLGVNKDDGTVDYKYLRNVFDAHTNKILIIHETFDHYPKDLSAEYFADKLPDGTIKRIMNFLESVYL